MLGLTHSPAHTSKGEKLLTRAETQVSSPLCSHSPGWVGKANEVIKARLKEPRCSHVENPAPAAAHKQQESSERGRAGLGLGHCWGHFSHFSQVLLFPELLVTPCDSTALRNKRIINGQRRRDIIPRGQGRPAQPCVWKQGAVPVSTALTCININVSPTALQSTEPEIMEWFRLGKQLININIINVNLLPTAFCSTEPGIMEWFRLEKPLSPLRPSCPQHCQGHH